MLSPVIAYFLIFRIGPMAYALGMSLLKWDLVDKPTFIGLANYINMLTNDPKFRASFLNTLFYTGMLLGAGIPLALIVAIFLDRIIISSLRSLYIAIYFLPVITSMVVVALVWKYLYDPGAGFINNILWTLRLSPQLWLSSPKQAMLSIVITGIWKNLGFSMVIFLAALQGIPSVFYEAAKIDGASRWDSFWRITLPLLMPVTVFVSIITLIQCFQVFTLVFMMTASGIMVGGGPGTSTLVIGLYTYHNAFLYSRYGYSAALAYVLFLVVFFFTVLQFQAHKRKVWQY